MPTTPQKPVKIKNGKAAAPMVVSSGLVRCKETRIIIQSTTHSVLKTRGPWTCYSGRKRLGKHRHNTFERPIVATFRRKHPRHLTFDNNYVWKRSLMASGNPTGCFSEMKTHDNPWSFSIEKRKISRPAAIVQHKHARYQIWFSLSPI